MATKINATPSNDVNFDANATFNDDFSKWLTEMVVYWPKYYTGCTFEIATVGVESVDVSTKVKPNQTASCKKSLYDSFNTGLKNKKITIKDISTGTKDAYSVTWNKDATTDEKETDDDKESNDEVSTKKTKKDNNEAPDGGKKSNKYISRLFGGAASNVLGGIQQGLSKLTEEHEKNSKLLEEIERIKELIK